MYALLDDKSSVMLSDILIFRKNGKISMYKNMIKYNILISFFLSSARFCLEIFLW